MSLVVPELKMLFAIPNGGKRNVVVAKQLKAEGVRAGVSDLCLPIQRHAYAGLYLEMKALDGRLSEAQIDWLQEVTDEGYCATVGYGADDGIGILEWYLGLRKQPPEKAMQWMLEEPKESRKRA